MTNKAIFKNLKKLISINTYTPFSHFKVAVIIVTDKGNFSGINFESKVVTNLGTCAERNAVFNGVSYGMKRIYELHLLSTSKKAQTYPCGACLQVLSEFMKNNDKIYIYNLSGKIVKTFKLSDLISAAKIN